MNPDSEVIRNVRYQVQLTDEEAEQVFAAAKEVGMEPGDFIRELAMEELESQMRTGHE